MTENQDPDISTLANHAYKSLYPNSKESKKASSKEIPELANNAIDNLYGDEKKSKKSEGPVSDLATKALKKLTK